MDSQAIDTAPLSERLGQGPVVLLVGQRYLESHDGFDRFVTAIATHLGWQQADYRILLRSYVLANGVPRRRNGAAASSSGRGGTDGVAAQLH